MLKERIKNRKTSLGSWMALPSPAIAEIFASTELDFVVVDMEHSSMSMRECEELIRVVDLENKAALVRLSSIDPVQAKRVMDAGASGIIVPMVKNREEALQMVKSVYYPPLGERGVGLARAQKYGPGFNSYFEKSKKETVVIVQIEHIEAVGNFKEIMSVEGVDGFIVGPYDLTASMGIAGEFNHPEYIKVLEKINEFSKAKKLLAGIHIVEPSIEELKRRIDEGYKFIAYSVDFRIVEASMKQALESVKEKGND